MRAVRFDIPINPYFRSSTSQISFMYTDPIVEVKEAIKGDPRLKLVAAKIIKGNFQPDLLIEVLHIAQNVYGYLPMSVLKYIAKSLRLPPSRVYSTVTFYHFFSLKPKGEHNCLVCTGTACYVKGAQQILDEVEKQFGLIPGMVSSDHKLGIQVARCIGACGMAPAVVLDDEMQPRANGPDIVHKINTKLLGL